MLIHCEECNKIYEYEVNDGFCPKCGCYNNISHQDAIRLDVEKKRRSAIREAREIAQSGSICDAESSDAYDMAGEYAPDCMEDSHKSSHQHTGGANVAAREDAFFPTNGVPKYTSNTGTTAGKPAATPNRPSMPTQPAYQAQNRPRNAGCSAGVWVFIIIVIIQLLIAFFSNN